MHVVSELWLGDAWGPGVREGLEPRLPEHVTEQRAPTARQSAASRASCHATRGADAPGTWTTAQRTRACASLKFPRIARPGRRGALSASPSIAHRGVPGIGHAHGACARARHAATQPRSGREERAAERTRRPRARGLTAAAPTRHSALGGRRRHILHEHQGPTKALQPAHQ